MTRSIARTLLLVAAAALGCAHRPSAKERRAAEIHHDLAVEAFRAGRAPDALREYDAALAIDGRLAEAHRGRGLVLDFAFARIDEAERAYRRALELRPEYPEAHNDLGQLLARTGRHEEALREFDLALGDMTYREPYVARCNKGLALWRMGRREEGHAELRACLSLAPSFCKGRRELGRILLDEGKMAEGITELAAYARSCEKVPDAHLQLGLARMRAGDVPGARESFERCAELAPQGGEGDECRRSLSLLVE
ncbi:tetratricopeptide repeat protein [Anaeromyxobacter sp. Fw109-5]|uniref:tetratricopeptide repeat protein n=1 Tax=Anaeromyxobacter sp. (strain Fw109-5) TaxID=404589 RepID=UPI000158A7D2|nr:tetratricopeptide repeat protein [Anaeromyxobacter sp. Fw109-5]ABS26665.1 Tetratricopeptide TPR_2 repeat protein [Anaeromyxobacter sp. Fw109-5]